MANQKNQGSNTGGINQSGTGGQSTGGRGKQQAGSTGAAGNEGNLGGSSTSNIGGGAGSTQPGGAGVPSMSGGPGSTAGSTTSAAKTGSTPTTGAGSPSHMGSGTGGGMSTAGSSGSGGTGTAAARSLYDQAKETAGQAYEVAADKATTKLEEQKSTLSGGLATVADSVRRVSENLRGPDVQDGISKFTAEYSDVAARKIEGVANYFEQKSVREMYTDVENFARRNPAVFVGGAFALGLVLSRFLKSGTSSQTSGSGSMHDGPISTATEHNSGQGIQGLAGTGGTTPGASIS